jgi:DNA-nicking Smr family endonuclease
MYKLKPKTKKPVSSASPYLENNRDRAKTHSNYEQPEPKDLSDNSIFNSHSPFASLAGLRANLMDRQREEELKKKEEALKAKKSKKLAQNKAEVAETFDSEKELDENEEQALFSQAMEGVAPLTDKKQRFVADPLPPEKWKLPSNDIEDLSVVQDLFDLVNGKSELDFSATDELYESHVKGLPASVMDHLRKGLFPIQDHLDLHGLTLPEAEEAINQFITKSVDLGRTCLLLVHGRGHRSPDGIPIIKRNLESLLLKGPVKKYILAFTTAKPIDGGSGASYILLRK